MPETVASVDVGTIRQRFNFDWCMDPDSGPDGIDTYWWWARSIRVDPNELIADDDEGNLWSVPFSTDGADEITFGDPVRVRETFVPVAAADGQAATAVVQRRRQKTVATALERPTKEARPGESNPAASAANPDEEETTTMDVDATVLRTRLGLPEDATEDQITEALSADQPETFTQEQVEAQVAAAREEAAAAAASAASTDDETVRFDRATAEQLQADAQAGRQAREQQIAAERDQVVAAAVSDGRIPPSRREHWRSMLDADPGAAATLEALDKGLIPVDERGTAKTGDDPGATAGAGTGLFNFDDEKGA